MMNLMSLKVLKCISKNSIFNLKTEFVRSFVSVKEDFQECQNYYKNEELLNLDLNERKKQVIYRCQRLGIKELEIVFSAWTLHNIDKLNKDKLEKFIKDIIYRDNMDLLKHINKTKPISQLSKNDYLRIVIEDIDNGNVKIND